MPQNLWDILTSSKEPSFAVLDGALFQNLPAALLETRLDATPLYRTTSSERIAAAPHLVKLSRRITDPEATAENEAPRSDVLTALRRIVGTAPTPVIWQGVGYNALFRHLRGLNMVEVPRGTDRPTGPDYAVTAPSGGSPTAPSGDGFELVTFRHGDANVIAQTLPAFDLHQWSRFLGPAAAIVFEPTDDWGEVAGAHLAPRPAELPPPRVGWLRLDGETMERVRECRLDRSARRITRYLRKHADQPTAEFDDAELAALTKTYMREAEQYGVQTEAGLGRWCYLQFTTRGQLTWDPSVRSVMSAHEPSVSPDERVRLILRMSGETMRAAS